MNDLISLSATQLAQKIRERSVSSVEVLDAYLEQISKYNSQLNAICTLDAERARQRAKAADEALAKGENWGVLHGLPITIKDCLETAGIRTTGGYKGLKNYVPTSNTIAVQRLIAAGAIVMGKTNLARLAGDFQSANDLFPRTNNPWDLNRTAGGSSGGSAAAVSAFLSPLDIGSDIGGSIRQPSHFCGIFGLKPTDRRVPTIGHIPEVPGMPKCIRQMLTIGPIARSIEDLQLAFPLITGSDLNQPDIPPVPLDTPTQKPLQNLRIAWTDQIEQFPVAQSIKLAMQEVAKKLTNAGIQIEQRVPKFDFVEAWRSYFGLSVYISLCSQKYDWDYVKESLSLVFREAAQGDRNLRKLSDLPGAIFPVSLNPNIKKYFSILTERDNFIIQMERELAQWDVWLCPVAMTTAFTHCARGDAVEIDGKKVPYMMASGAYTIPFSFTGHPVVVIPIGFTENNLPIGMQIVGQRWREMELLSIAQNLFEIVGQYKSPKL
ncbi:amidase [Aerosakkonemataceae cyanobacterium BLCC-F50]|uniref:Amidase n=1 Tax=Floridaenema flaviceps BLCC-F50 TaxID=3153642 RepID=A0ABV4XLE3_9CYAN